MTVAILAQFVFAQALIVLMALELQVANAGGAVCTVSMEASATVVELKAAIELHTGIPAAGQRLFYGLAELHGTRSLGQQLGGAAPVYELLLVRRTVEQTEWLQRVAQNGQALGLASAEIRADRDVVAMAVAAHGHALRLASAELRGDRDVVGAAVARNGGALQYASAAVRGDHTVVLAAVRQDGEALAYASAALRDDREVVQAAVAQDADASRYASAALQAELGV